ncbi:FxsA protein [hydrothermal vent metagenome]|uniref:FxsA protein n=1 Tax=hydrothermal vent metagenome TaxID=652676 RepID=A0A3B0TR07_9ZZZZ
MGRILFLLFLIVPIIEIGIFIIVGQLIGLWLTLAGVVVTALLGSFIIRIQGFSLIREIQQLMAAGVLPTRQIADGLILAIAGALLLTPGYFTDTIGFLLLVPQIRTLIYQEIKKRISISGGFGSADSFSFDAEMDDLDPFNNSAPGSHHNIEKENDNDDVVDLEQDNWRPKS